MALLHLTLRSKDSLDFVGNRSHTRSDDLVDSYDGLVRLVGQNRRTAVSIVLLLELVSQVRASRKAKASRGAMLVLRVLSLVEMLKPRVRSQVQTVFIRVTVLLRAPSYRDLTSFLHHSNTSPLVGELRHLLELGWNNDSLGRKSTGQLLCCLHQISRILRSLR